MDTTSNVTVLTVDDLPQYNHGATETETFQKSEVNLTKGSYVVFNRNGKVRFARVITKGKTNIGLDVAGMSSNTKIPATTELIPLTVFVSRQVLDNLQAEQAA